MWTRQPRRTPNLLWQGIVGAAAHLDEIGVGAHDLLVRAARPPAAHFDPVGELCAGVPEQPLHVHLRAAGEQERGGRGTDGQ
jgi:hypothetical protein